MREPWSVPKQIIFYGVLLAWSGAGLAVAVSLLCAVWVLTTGQPAWINYVRLFGLGIACWVLTLCALILMGTPPEPVTERADVVESSGVPPRRNLTVPEPAPDPAFVWPYDASQRHLDLRP